MAGKRERVWGEVLSALASGLPADYEEFTAAARALGRCFHCELATAMQPRLNSHLRTLPSDTYAEKQYIATWVNEQLRELGLAIRCPKTGKPANLIADVQAGEDSASRFRLDVRTDEGGRTRTFSSRDLFDLELMEDATRQEPLSRRFRNRS